MAAIHGVRTREVTCGVGTSLIREVKEVYGGGLTNREVFAKAVKEELSEVIRLITLAGCDCEPFTSVRRPHTINEETLVLLEAVCNPIVSATSTTGRTIAKSGGPPAFSRGNLMRCCLMRAVKRKGNKQLLLF